MNQVYVCGGQRTPFVKSMGAYQKVTMQELMTASLEALVTKMNLQGKLLGDVALGGVMNSSSDWNLARECVLGTSLHPNTPAYNVQRACGLSLETLNQIAMKIKLGQIEWGIGGGVDTNTDLPVLFSRKFSEKIIRLSQARTFGAKLSALAQFRPSDWKPVFPAVVEPRTGKSMGQHCESMVQEWKITRQEQDQIAFESHQKAAQAYKEGFYQNLVVEFNQVKKDLIVREDTTIEKLAKLKPVFDFSGQGTLTAGNSTALTDGSSCVLLASEKKADQENLPKLARFVDCEVAALDFVHGEGLLMAPTLAVARLLKRNGLKLQDFDFYEIHEAFAGQVLCNLKAWDDEDYCKRVLGEATRLGTIDRSRMNVKGGSLALGHPFGATGARIVASLAHILKNKGQGRGLISICTAGGMGVAAILEA
ncbi:MAG: acetyl-CoA C-acetyltransferase [Bdellovibrionales bacterium]